MGGLLKGQSYICYIDESGDEGFQFNSGSSEWFILSGLVSPAPVHQQVIHIVDAVKAKLRHPPKKALHWRDLRPLEKEYYATQIASAPCAFVTVGVHKPSIVEIEKFQQRYRLYFYTVRYLLERVTWLVRDLHKRFKQGSGLVRCVFSNRSSMNYTELKEYLQLLKKRSDEGQDIRIVWNNFNPNDVLSYPPGRLRGLQIADAISGAFYNALETQKTREQISDYAIILKDIALKYRGRIWGYGLKVVPREGQKLVETEDKWKWSLDFR